MKYGFYFRFYNKIHNDFLSVILSSITYLLFCVKYVLEKIRSKKRTVSVNSSNALNMSAYYYQKKFKDKMYKLFSENMWNALHDKDFYKHYVFLDNGIILDRNTLQDHYTGERYKGIYFHDYLLCYQKV